MELVLAIVTAAVNIILVLVVFSKNSKSAQHRFFAGLIFVNSLYPIFNYFSLHATSQETAFVWAKLAIFTGICTGPLYFFFVDTFSKTHLKARRFVVAGLVAWWALNGILLTTNQLFQSIMIVNGQPQLTPGMAIPSFGLMMLITLISGSWRLIRMYRHSTGLERVQLQLVMFGLVVGFGLTLLATIVLPLAFSITLLIPISSLFLLIPGVLISYAIVAHRLFDVKAIVARSVVYILLLAILGGLYAAGFFGISRLLFQDHLDPIFQNLLNIFLAVILAFTFQPIRLLLERVTNRIFYRYHYDSQAVLNNFSKILVSELDLDRILKLSLGQLCDSLHIQFAQVIVYNQDRVYRIEHYGPLPKRLMVAPELAKLDKPMLVADELDGGERKSLMEGHGVRVAMTLRTRDEFIGHLLLGDKLSGDIYSSQDVQLLEIIGKELAVAIQNAKAYAIIQEFNATLQAKVERSTNRLRVANRHLKELDKAKDEFISMASHQLRTPLTTIKGYLSMMQEGDAGPISDGQKQFVTYAFDASQRMVNLISDLLNVSRMSAGRFLIQTHPTDMVQMIDDEVRQLQSHARTKSLALVFDHPANPLPLIEIDEGKTRQVIMNFIDNAIYYTQTGEVRVVLEQTGDRVRLEVRDTGIGVPKDAQKQLFTKFYRAENAQTVRPDGTGLGLYLAKRVIEDQGGTIIFKSTEGKGSTFGFELPLRKPTPPKKTEAKSDDTKQVDKKEDKAHARTQST